MITLRGRLITPDHDLPDALVDVEGDRVVGVRPVGPGEPTAASGQVILPGVVDLHCHGGGGASFTTGDPDQVAAAAAHHLSQGTTSLLGSAVTDAPERMLAVVAALADAVEHGLLAGVHSEGPFLAPACCGAQDPAWLTDPDAGFARELVAAARGRLRVVTMAPELPGAAEVAEVLAEAGVVVAVGHTGADAATAHDFLTAFAPSLVTHLFNGMPAFHHRDPGPAAGGLTAAVGGAARVELIADGVHVADATTAAVLALLPGRVALVSDAMAAAGMPDGDYVLGPQEVTVSDGVARLTHGDSIAGGTSRLLDIVRRQIAAGVDPRAVVAAATAVPAAVLGLDHELGSLTPGLRADLVVTDADLRPVRVMRAGEWVA